MELDRPPPPGPPARPAGADEDEVVAEYDLVLCQPSGADTEVRKTERAERMRGTDSASLDQTSPAIIIIHPHSHDRDARPRTHIPSS